MSNIIYVKGDLLAPELYVLEEHKDFSMLLGHQVNALGVMGGGVALSIREKYPDVYEQYKSFCSQLPEETYAERLERLLGSAQFVETELNPNLYIVNLFGQFEIGTHKRQTNYEWLYKALCDFFAFSTAKDNVALALPYNIGCGLGGGKWHIVKAMIESAHSSLIPDTPLYIVEFTG